MRVCNKPELLIQKKVKFYFTKNEIKNTDQYT